MRIAYLINQYPKVSHSFIRREILALERQGFKIERIAIRGWKESLPDEEDRREQRLTRYVLYSGLGGLLLPTLRVFLGSPARFAAAIRLAAKMARDAERSLIYHLIYVAEACRVLRWSTELKVRRIHAHFGTNSTEVAMLMHVLGGPPYSFTVHGPDEFMRPMGLEDKIHRCSFVVAISSFGRSQLYLRAKPLDWWKINVVHCGLEKSFYEPELAVPKIPNRLVCVGRLCEAKGQLLLIEAAAGLAARGIAFELVLAGDGPMRGEIEQLIEKHGISDRVRITGWISSDDVRREILAARALVLPSFAEGLPVVIMEAMALRRPVLSTYVAGIPELVRPGVDGWLFPAGSVKELEMAMEDCLSRPRLELETFGEAAHARVVGRHLIDTEAGKLAELLRNSN